jgi:sugar-specific transcriptional regulator TrmB
LLVDYLKELGLSDLEARCYLTMLEEPSLSGYEIAKRVSTSRTNVYSALRSLTDKGVCQMIEGKTVQYDPVPIDQVIRYLRTNFERNAEVLIKELSSPPRTNPVFYTWKGEQHIENAINRLIANATKHIIVDIWSEDFNLIESPLLIAEKKGITVIPIIIGEYQTILKNKLIHKEKDLYKTWPQVETRKFSVLTDSETAILGGFGGTVKMSALETNHPSVIQLLKNAFYDDVIMTHLEADYGEELIERYGKDYEKIINYYNQEKGWDL